MKRIAGELFMLLLGPIHFSGEMVGPTGETSLKIWLYAIVGTWIWLAVAWMVVK